MGKPYRVDKTRWRKLRAKIFKQEPYCRECKKVGIIRSPKELDHIIAISKGGPHWDESNLQPLCTECHREKTAQESTIPPWRR